MFASLMRYLPSHQRLLTAVHRHVSLSRELGCVAAYASAASSSRRRRRRPTDPEPALQQEADLERVTARDSCSRQPHRQHDRVREQLFQQAAGLGLMRASELEAMAREQRSAPAVSLDQHNGHSAPENSSSGTDGSVRSGELHMHSTSSSRSTSSSDSSHFKRGGRGSSSSEEGAEASSSGRGIITEEDEAIIAAMNRISRFMDFRERCAAEVIAKLVGLGYEQQFAYKVLKRLQRLGLQDDARFAQMYAQGQWSAKAAAPARIAYELRQKCRVPEQHIDAALKAVFGDSKQLAGREASDDQSEASWEKLVEVCRQRVQQTHTEHPTKRRVKLANWLQRRGHSLSTAFKMFEELGI